MSAQTPEWGNLALRDKARSILESSHSYGEPFIDRIEGILENIGFKLHFFSPDDPEISTILGAVHHADKMIFLNDNLSAFDSIFTLAHEIGHAVLHSENIVDYRKNIQDSPDGSDKATNTQEREADVFTYEILMPTYLIWNLYKQKYSIGHIATEFKVSERLIRERLLFLNTQNDNSLIKD